MDIKPTNFATIARMLMSTAHQINSSPCEPHTPAVAAPAQDRFAHITAHKSRNPSYLSQQAGRHDKHHNGIQRFSAWPGKFAPS